MIEINYKGKVLKFSTENATMGLMLDLLSFEQADVTQTQAVIKKLFDAVGSFYRGTDNFDFRSMHPKDFFQEIVPALVKGMISGE